MGKNKKSGGLKNKNPPMPPLFPGLAVPSSSVAMPWLGTGGLCVA